MITTVFIGHSFIAPRQYEFAMEVARQKVKTVVLCPVKWAHLKYELTEEEINEWGYYERIGLPSYGSTIYDYNFNDFTQIIESLKPDIIYSAGEPQSYISYKLTKLAKKIGSKIAIFTWENIFKLFPSPFSYFEKYNIENSDLIIAGNNEAKEIMQKKGVKKEKLFVLPHTGINTSKFKPLNINKDFTYLFVGRLVKEKGISMLDEVMAGENITWIGKGDIKPVNGNIIGFVNWDDLPLYYNKASFFIHNTVSNPYWKEQFGYTIAEALSCGIPVIAPNSGSIPEIYSKAPVLFFKECNIDSLKKAIETSKQIINDEINYKTLSKSAREFILKNLDNKIIAKKLLEIFKKVIE